MTGGNKCENVSACLHVMGGKKLCQCMRKENDKMCENSFVS